MKKIQIEVTRIHDENYKFVAICDLGKFVLKTYEDQLNFERLADWHWFDLALADLQLLSDRKPESDAIAMEFVEVDSNLFSRVIPA